MQNIPTKSIFKYKLTKSFYLKLVSLLFSFPCTISLQGWLWLSTALCLFFLSAIFASFHLIAFVLPFIDSTCQISCLLLFCFSCFQCILWVPNSPSLLLIINNRFLYFLFSLKFLPLSNAVIFSTFVHGTASVTSFFHM